MWVIVPVKPFEAAKQRLSPVLSDAEREALAEVMLLDVLTMLKQAQRVSGVLIVSREERAARMASAFNRTFLQEDAVGLSNAVRQGADHMMANGERSVLMIPGDVPLASAAEIDQLIGQHTRRPAASLVPDSEGVGTNAIAVSPPDLISFAFGEGSFQAHHAAAKATGVHVNIVKLPGLALDIDTPDDLRRLIRYESESETLGYLCDQKLVSRLTLRGNSQRINAAR